MAPETSQPPLYSILLPTHNRPEVLGLAIRSVLAQTVADFELLVVGDGCTDHTAAVVAAFADPRIRWFDLPKGAGFGYANRNLALQQATGRLVAFLGHDNLYFADHLGAMARPFDNPAVQFAYSRPLWIADDGLVIPFFVNLGLPGAFRDFLATRNVLPASCIVHRRSCFDEVGYWPEDIEASGDWELWKRILTRHKAASLRLVRAPTCLHFRADWRDHARWAPPPFGYLRALADTGHGWPDALRLRLDPSKGTPQSQVWDRMQAEGPGFVARIRAGTAIAQDMLAWHAGMDPNFR